MKLCLLSHHDSVAVIEDEFAPPLVDIRLGIKSVKYARISGATDPEEPNDVMFYEETSNTPCRSTPQQ